MSTFLERQATCRTGCCTARSLSRSTVELSLSLKPGLFPSCQRLTVDGAQKLQAHHQNMSSLMSNIRPAVPNVRGRFRHSLSVSVSVGYTGLTCIEQSTGSPGYGWRLFEINMYCKITICIIISFGGRHRIIWRATFSLRPLSLTNCMLFLPEIQFYSNVLLVVGGGILIENEKKACCNALQPYTG